MSNWMQARTNSVADYATHHVLLQWIDKRLKKLAPNLYRHAKQAHIQ